MSKSTPHRDEKCLENKSKGEGINYSKISLNTLHLLLFILSSSSQVNRPE